MQNQKGEKTQSAKVEKYDWRVVFNNKTSETFEQETEKETFQVMGLKFCFYHRMFLEEYLGISPSHSS